MSALFQTIPLQPIRYFHYHAAKGRSKVKSGIAHELSIEDAFSNELEPLCRFLKSNAQAHLNQFYQNNTKISHYNAGTHISHGKTCKGSATIFDATCLPKAKATFAFYARMFAFFIYYNNYIRYVAEQYCSSKNFAVTFAETYYHVINTIGCKLDKYVFESIIRAKRVSNVPNIGKLVIPFSDMDNGNCLPKYFKYDKANGILTSHFRTYTGGIVVQFRLPKYFRDEVARICGDPQHYTNIKFTKPTLVYDDTQEDPMKRFTWSCTISYTVSPISANNNKILTFDLGEKNHAVMTVIDKNGAYSNQITPGKEHKHILLKIGANLHKIRCTRKRIDHYQRCIRKIKKRNPTSPAIQKIRDNQIAPRVTEIRRCIHKNHKLKKILSWLLARDIKRVCTRMKISKVVTENLAFASKGQWAKGQDLKCITWACAKAGIEVIAKSMYYASQTCPFCGSYIQTEYKNCRLSKCNGIPVPEDKKHSKVHPKQKLANSDCRWKGDRDYTASLCMGSKYFKRNLEQKKLFIIGATPLSITQR